MKKAGTEAHRPGSQDVKSVSDSQRWRLEQRVIPVQAQKDR